MRAKIVSSKTEKLNREQLISEINESSIKHLWLANQIGVSEKTLSRWVSGDVTRIRSSNLNKLAIALDCSREVLIAEPDKDDFPTDKNRNVLVNELNNDGLLYQLLVSSKIKLAISLIKSTFHSSLPSGVIANFYIKLGYASLIHRKFRTAKKYITKGLTKAEVTNDNRLIFSANLGLAITYFFECDYHKCQNYLIKCEQNMQYSGQEKAHLFNTFAMYYLYTGELQACIDYANKCIEECAPNTGSIEKELFLSSALQLRGASQLLSGNTDQARLSCVESLNAAEQSKYKRSIAVSKAYLAAVHAVCNKTDLARKLIDESFKLVNNVDISYPSLLCIKAFIFRKSGEVQSLRELSSELISISKPNSSLTAFMHYQEYLVLRQQKDSENAEQTKEQIKTTLRNLELTNWIKAL